MKEMKITWPQACRAEAKFVAYDRALRLLCTKPVVQAIQLLEEDLQREKTLLADYRKQQGTYDMLPTDHRPPTTDKQGETT